MTNEVKNVPELRFPEFSEEWEDNLVGNIFEFKNGLNKGKEYFGYGIPIVNFKDVFHNRGIKSEYLNGKVDVSEKELQNYSVRKGDVFFTRTSEIIEEIGYPTVMMDEIPKAVFSGFVLRARPKKNSKLVDDKFKRYVFFTYSFRKEMITKSSITTRALTSGTAINKMKVIYPTSIEEQNKIGDFFRKLDRQIELEEQKLSLLEEQKKGYMQKIFYQELRFKDENGNNYPEWEEKKLGNLISEISIKTKTNNQYTLLSSTKNGLVSQEEYFRKQIGSKDNTGYKILKLNQMVISPQNLWLGNINFNEQFNIGIVSPSYRVFELNTTFYLPFAKNILRSARYIYEYSQASEQGASVVRRNLNIDLFNDIKINLPIIEEQEKIGNFFSEIDKIIEKQSQKIDGLKSRKKGFLQKMFV
ncbi:restriction endonuclease subunit S [Staphylococcus equorum]|uniref:restriction endonuclease subunit S n=1 Tax=Staphylococcus equorum TaxID=246432 RepID=UPI0025562508|nr:restriction endonuclease subunit S [Staphylococcus equorum]MDK9853280.1 restriction endonuclease subunit S [Staphylococcus equorum]